MWSRIWMSLPHSWSLWLLHSYHKTYSAYISQTFCSFLQPIFPYCAYKSCLTLKAKKWSVYLSPNTNLAPVSEYSRKVYRQKKMKLVTGSVSLTKSMPILLDLLQRFCAVQGSRAMLFVGQGLTDLCLLGSLLCSATSADCFQLCRRTAQDKFSYFTKRRMHFLILILWYFSTFL